jgi:hypothetical protein
VTAQGFVQMVHDWVEGIRAGADIFAKYEGDLKGRQLASVAEIVREGLSCQTTRTVLLLDEMDQAYPHFLERIDTADHQPLRALIDSCINSKLRILMAYAPESFHALGDADRGRMLRLPIPSLDATAIQKVYGLTRGEANFAWWASRGRARGIIKAVNEVIIPQRRGDFGGQWLGLAEALDGLPGVFGVPAVLRGNIPIGRLGELLDLVPHPDENAKCYIVNVRDKLALGRSLMTKLDELKRFPREDLEVVVGELLQVLDAVADANDQCALTFDDFSAGVKLAAARTVEAGKLTESPEGLEAGSAFFSVAQPSNKGLALPIPLSRLADEIFPSPFTDPVLPLSDGRLPGQTDIDRLFSELVPNDVIFEWADHDCWIFRNLSALQRWLAVELTHGNESNRWRALLLSDSGEPGNLLSLARYAGRLELKSVGQFQAWFLKCLAIRASQSGLGRDLSGVASMIKVQDRQPGRKIDWHLRRLEGVIEEMNPNPSKSWQLASSAARSDNINRVLPRLGEEGTGILALVYLFRTCRADTKRVLSELAEFLSENGDLRKLVRAAGTGGRLEGAAVVVDELLPRQTGGRSRWVDMPFAGQRELSAVLDSFGSAENAAVLGRLLNPHAAGRLERLIRFYIGELPDLRPERQHLDALQGINEVMRRAKRVHKSLSTLLGVPEDRLGASVGGLIGQAIAAQPTIAAFNRIAKRIEKVEEPWARALALWVGAVFAERIWSGVERDEASLRAWEAVADQGRPLAGAIDSLSKDLRRSGLARTAEFLSQERGRLRASLNDADVLQSKIEELHRTVEDLGQMCATLSELKTLTHDRGVEISPLFQRFQPSAGRMSEERELFRRVVELIGPVQGNVPAPVGDDLRTYAGRLIEFGEKTRTGRLRLRVSRALGLPSISEEIVLDSDDVDTIETACPKLNERFIKSCRESIEYGAPKGSDNIVMWVTEGLRKQQTLESSASYSEIAALDERVFDWAAEATSRPTELDDVLATRDRAHYQLMSLGNSVSTGVTEELVESAAGMEVP